MDAMVIAVLITTALRYKRSCNLKPREKFYIEYLIYLKHENRINMIIKKKTSTGYQ